jgi:hypothetical protein
MPIVAAASETGTSGGLALSCLTFLAVQLDKVPEMVTWRLVFHGSSVEVNDDSHDLA